jgi:hypothetical protein
LRLEIDRQFVVNERALNHDFGLADQSEASGRPPVGA